MCRHAVSAAALRTAVRSLSLSVSIQRSIAVWGVLGAGGAARRFTSDTMFAFQIARLGICPEHAVCSYEEDVRGLFGGLGPDTFERDVCASWSCPGCGSLGRDPVTVPEDFCEGDHCPMLSGTGLALWEQQESNLP